MAYRLFTDIVVIVHLGFVLFVVLGGFLALRWRWVIWLHLPAAIWGILIEFAGWTCPLTPLENYLQRQGGEMGYRGGFIEHYLVSVLYPDMLTRGLQIVLGFAALAVNLCIYWRVLSRLQHGR
ncbi:MAG: DUF2784 domain-containing protein [Proteobacteria bacterium]|nr:DUF2784 domain-containing protein [Pseudomonadota bacterium]